MSKLIPFGIESFNEMITIPKKLTTDDGRELIISQWSPVAEGGSEVVVTLRATIRKETKPMTPFIPQSKP